MFLSIRSNMGINKRSSTNTTCLMPAHLIADASENFVGNFTFHQFNEILSGSCTAVTCSVVFFVMAQHAMNLSNPNQQIKIMRIATLFPLYSIFSLLSICFPDAYVYLVGWIQVFQGVAIYSFLMLLCDFLAPNDQHRAEFFTSIRIPTWSKNKTTDGLSWFQRTWFRVLQYPFVAFITAIAQCITQARGIYCLESNNTQFAHLWINIIQIVSLTMAMIAILGFYRNLNPHMREHKPLLKLFAFKLVVGLEFLEKIIFMILSSTGALKPSGTLSYADTIIGLPTMIICLQVVPFAAFLHYAYSVKPYKIPSVTHADVSQQYLAVDDNETGSPYVKGYQGGPLGIHAWLALWNPMELFRDIKSTASMFRDARNGTKPEP